MKVSARIESFLNGNILLNKPALRKRTHRTLRVTYQQMTGCSDEKAIAFADFIYGFISFQAYADTPEHAKIS